VRNAKQASGGGIADPEIRVNEVERLSVLDRRPLGITTGFVFYANEADPPLH
jgi:hypothetical protein